jgi:hypothetical protein
MDFEEPHRGNSDVCGGVRALGVDFQADRSGEDPSTQTVQKAGRPGPTTFRGTGATDAGPHPGRTQASRVCQTAAGPLHTADTSDPADAVDSDSALRAGSRRGFHRDLPLRAGPGSHGCDPPLENTGGIS